MELMRGLAFIALLFAGSAVGAELRQAEVCTDGTTHQAGYCPAVLSSASCSATGATTGSCSATSDEADGTRYVCATSNNTALTCAEIIACSGGAAISGASAVETGSNSIALSGLTTDAAHYGQICNLSPEQWASNRPISASFTPVDAGGDPYDLYASDTQSRGTIPFAVNWPAEPTITSEATVTNVSELTASLAVNGRRTIVSAGTYNVGGGLGLIGGNDKQIVLQAGATIQCNTNTYFADFSTQRLVIDGGTWNCGFQLFGTNGALPGGGGGSDALVKNGTYIGNTLNAFQIWDYVRAAFVSNEISLNNFNLLGSSSAAGQFDLILAGNYIHPVDGAGGSAVRISRGTRIIVVDNLLAQPDGSFYHAFRKSYDTDDLWFRGNQMQGDSTQGFRVDPNYEQPAQGTTSGDVYIYDNLAYSEGFMAAVVVSETSLNAAGNVMYTTWGGENSSGQWFDPGSGNPVNSAWSGAYPGFSPWTE